MATTITGAAVTFNDASTQTTGTSVGLHTITTTWTATYPVGHYLLIENQSKGSFTVACPLNGWDSSVYSAPVIVYGQTYTGPTTASYTQGTGLGTNEPITWQRATVGGSYAAAGTWRSRGGNLICFLVQRVA